MANANWSSAANRAVANGATVFSRQDSVALDVVYCLRNDAMPGLYKIGYTTRASAVRANELYAGYRDEYTTGVPAPFEVVREWELPRGRGVEVERAIHRELSARRPNPSREFFRFDGPEQVVAAVEAALRDLDWYATAIAEATLKRQEAELRAERQQAQDAARRREQARVAEISTNVERTMRLKAENALHQACQLHGLYWAGAIGSALGIVGALSDARDAYFVLVFLFSIGAYYWNRSTPLDRHFASDAYRTDLAAAKERAIEHPVVVRETQPAPTVNQDLAKEVKVNVTAVARVRCPDCWARVSELAADASRRHKCKVCGRSFSFEERAPVSK